MPRTAALVLVSVAFALLAAANADKVLAGGSAGWSERDWYVQVDGVMGGRSSGDISFPSSSAMQFSGVISLNGGGFSSVRSNMMRHDLSSYAGVSVAFETLVPGSVPLGMHLQFAVSGSRYSFAAAYAIPPGQNAGDTATVFLPLWGFNRATSSGFLCSSCQFDPSQVIGIDFYMLFQEGPFSVKILNVTALDSAPPPPPGPTTPLADGAAVASLVSGTIDKSAYLYDQGYTEIATALFDTTARLVAASTSATDASRDAACSGLKRASQVSADPTDRAWVLRRALDNVLAAEKGTPVKAGSDYPTVAQGNWTATKQTTGWDECRSGHPVTYPLVKQSPPAADAAPASTGATQDSPTVSGVSRGVAPAASTVVAATAAVLLWTRILHA